MVGAPTHHAVEAALYLASANIIGMFGAYASEYVQRQNYLVKASLHSQANRDGLTGLHNRRYLEEQLPRLWRQARRNGDRFAAAFFDVDYFKAYNDY